MKLKQKAEDWGVVLPEVYRCNFNIRLWLITIQSQEKIHILKRFFKDNTKVILSPSEHRE